MTDFKISLLHDCVSVMTPFVWTGNRFSPVDFVHANVVHKEVQMCISFLFRRTHGHLANDTEQISENRIAGILYVPRNVLYVPRNVLYVPRNVLYVPRNVLYVPRKKGDNVYNII